MDLGSAALADFFGTSKDEFYGEDTSSDTEQVVETEEVEEQVEVAPVVRDDNSELISRLDRMESAAAAREADEKERLDRVLADLIAADEPEAEPDDFAKVSARATNAEQLVLELATKQTILEVSAAVEKHGVDRQELVDAVIASQGGDPDVLAERIAARAASQEKAYLDRLSAKNPAIAAALAAQAQGASKKGQDAPTLKGAPTGVVQSDPTAMKRKSGETSAQHLERLMEAGASIF